MMKLKKLILIVLAVFIMLSTILQTTNVLAASTKTLGVVSIREGGYGYQIYSTDIWKLVNKTNSGYNYSEAIYCLKAGVGLGGAFGIAEDEQVVYDVSYDMKQPGNIPTQYRNVLPSDDKYNAILWIIDNMYLPKHTPEAERKNMRDVLLSAAFSTPAGIAEGATLDNCYITDDDIEVVQQLAIWYFTNTETNYHVSTNLDFLPLWVSKDGDSFGDLGKVGPDTNWNDPIPQGEARQIEAMILYKYLVSEAQANASKYGTGANRDLTSTPITFADTTKTINLSGSNYIVGPFKINGMNNTNYTLDLEVTNELGTKITNYSILDENKNILTNPQISDYTESEFYISIPTTVQFESIKLNAKSSYFKTNATFWTSSTSYATEQPVVIVEKEPSSDTVTATVDRKVGEYNLKLIKIDGTDNSKLANAKFSIVLPDGTTKEYTTDANGVITISDLSINKVERQDIVIKEIQAPDGYKLLKNEIKLQVVTKETTDAYDVDTITPTGIDKNNVDYNNSTKTLEVTIPNYKFTGEYKLKLVKEDESGNNKLANAQFKIQLPDGIEKLYTTDSNGLININNIIITKAEEQTIKIKEIQAPAGYKVNTSEIILKVTTRPNDTNDKYIVSEVVATGIDKDNVIYNSVEETVEVTIPNKKITGKYDLKVLKLDGLDNSYLKDATFSIVLPDGSAQEKTTDSNGILTIEGIAITGLENHTITIKEIKAPNGYKLVNNTITITVTFKEENEEYVVSTVKATGAADDDYRYNNLTNTVEVTVKNYKQIFDLALRKYITAINKKAPTVNREPVVDITPLVNGETTAIYKHPKNALTVKRGDVVTYTIRIYNEGEIDGYADIVKDYLPAELEFVKNSDINKKYGWTLSDNGREITTEYLKGNVIKAFDGTTLSYKDLLVECTVKESAKSGRVMTNIAQIEADSNITPDIPDIDSTPDNLTEPNDDKLPAYKGDNSNKTDLADKDYYYKGKEDDDDFEKIIIEAPFDLSLRKFITGVNDKEITNRIPQVTVTPLANGTKTTAIYNHTKDPVVVRNGDIVIYTIRIYNEGELNGYAELIKDNIPEGLEFIVDNKINIEYRWKLVDGNAVQSDYLSMDRDENNMIKAFNPETMQTLDYKDVKIAFKVIEPNTSDRILINIAEIADDADEDGNDIEDRDSTPNNDKESEDDIDKEYLKLQYFDLALRKFITDVNGEKVTTRVPQVNIDKDGKITYTHTKDPVLVANSDVVTYTLRVYNEGKIDGYANEVKDDIPEGLEFLPNHETNKKYEWVMYDEKGKETTEASKAVTIKTAYLSESKDENNIIKAFDRENMKEPAYKEVEVAFKVIEKNLPTSRIIINTAEISKDSDDDIDSTPDNDKEDEDDIDKEYLKVKYFDLSLLKWVSKVIMTEDGKTTITETGYNGLENPEPVVKVDIDKKKINKIVLKFGYKIKITNEGEIAGYATEISDYIPEGLEFHKEDNPDWELDGEGKVVTNKLAKTLLQPGETAEVEIIFRWKNNAENLGLKRNVAEISEDDNDKDAEDIDSTPDNKKEGEDDIDEALVILSVKTGAAETIYFGLGIVVLAMLSGGIILIKKYVL